MWQIDINVMIPSAHTRLGMKTICATNAVHDRSDRSAIMYISVHVRLKTQENTQIIEELTSNVPRHVNIVGLLNLGGGGGGGASLPGAPSPRSAPVSTCISAVANRGTVSCGYNRTRYAKYTQEYLMSRPEGGGGGGVRAPGAPPPPPPLDPPLVRSATVFTKRMKKKRLATGSTTKPILKVRRRAQRPNTGLIRKPRRRARRPNTGFIRKPRRRARRPNTGFIWKPRRRARRPNTGFIRKV